MIDWLFWFRNLYDIYWVVLIVLEVKLCFDLILLGVFLVSYLMFFFIWFNLMFLDKILFNFGEKFRCLVIFVRCLVNFLGIDCYFEIDIGNGVIGSVMGIRWGGSRVLKIGRKDDGMLISSECFVWWISVIGWMWCSLFVFWRICWVLYFIFLLLFFEMILCEWLEIKF